MSYRDTFLFKAVGAITLNIELFFSDVGWRGVSPYISEPIRVLVFFVAGAALVVLSFSSFLHFQLFVSKEVGVLALFFLILLYVPQFSPVFCFFRPTIRQFPNLKDQLRQISGVSERSKFPDMVVYWMMFFGMLSLTGKELGAKSAAWQFLIVAPFFWMAFLQSKWRYFRWLRAERLAQKLAPNAPPEMINVGSWSNKFAQSYLFDVCFFLSMILSPSLLR